MSVIPLKASTIEREGDLHASKWLKHQFLLSKQEHADLFTSFEGFVMYQASGPVYESLALITRNQFLKQYSDYIDSIVSGREIDISQWRRFFCNYLTVDPEALYKIVLTDGRVIIKASRPTVQMQLHTFFPSDVDGKFHSMVMASDCIHFGLQISYPQIFEDPKTHQFSKTLDSSVFPNTSLFKHIVRYLRSHTVPTPLLFKGQRSVAPFRIGKECFPWINNHVGCIKKQLQVVHS